MVENTRKENYNKKGKLKLHVVSKTQGKDNKHMKHAGYTRYIESHMCSNITHIPIVTVIVSSSPTTPFFLAATVMV